MQSIGDFAEALILGQVDDVKSGKALAPSLEEAASNSGSAPAKDIRNIEVPNAMMKQILGEGYTQEEPAFETQPELVWTDPEGEPEPAPAPQQLTEETAQTLIGMIEEMKGMISELKMLQEMSMGTTAGALGCNLGGPGLSEPVISKNNGYVSPKDTKRKKRKALSAALRKRK